MAPALADLGVPQPGVQQPQASRWADLRTRTLSAAILAPVAVLCVWYGGWAWAALLAAGGIGLGLEWATLCGFAGLTLPSLALAACLVAAGVAALLGQHLAALGVLTLGMALSWRLGGAWLAWGVPYIGVPLLAMSWLRERPLPVAAGSDAVGRADVLFVVLVVWASDIGAYIAGRLIGGPKLAPAISPGKTRSGALGGLVAAMAVGAAAAHGLGLGSPGRAAVIAGVLAVASQVGDLFESWVKRRFGVKDSGWLIPGHGGLFDRMDGLLAAAPTAAALAIMAGRGGVLWN